MKDYTKPAKHCMITVVLLTEFDQEQYDRIRRREGFEEGAQQKAVEAALLLIKKYKASPEEAATDMNAPLELVLERLEKEVK